MLFYCSKYLNIFLQKSVLSIGFLFTFAIAASAQTGNANSVRSTVINPLLLSAFKNPLKANPLFAERIKPAKHELMYWPNFPLNPAQVEARYSYWNRKNQQTIGQQIASDIIENAVNTLIYGKKTPVAVRPKF